MQKRLPLFQSEDSGPVSGDLRQGSILLLTCLCLVGLMAAAALSIDVGYIQMQKTRMQNAVDAAALAASQEITQAIRNAPIGTQDPTAYAIGRARLVASHVAGLSGIYIDPNRDVMFGQRQFDKQTSLWTISWNGPISNTVRVIARRSSDDTTAQDGKLNLFFGGVLGTKFATVQTEATAFVKARDIVVIHDFSRSMNFDSHFPLTSETTNVLPDAQIVSNMQLLWSDLQPTNTGNMTFTPQYAKISSTSGGVTSSCTFRYMSCDVTSSTALRTVKVYYGSNSTKSYTYTGTATSVSLTLTGDITKVDVTSVSGSSTRTITLEDTNANVVSALGFGTYPFNGGSTRWTDYVQHCRTDQQIIAKGYREMYGGLTFVNFILRSYSSYSDTPKLSTSRHYPFTSIKEGHQQLCNFLRDLSFGDHVGMVSYDTSHRIETIVNDTSNPAIPYVNISSTPLTEDYTAVNNLMKYKQANYYSPSTNMGGGLASGIQLLDGYARPGSQPTILLMTDGNSNVTDKNVKTSLPTGWNWNTMFDYDGDGVKDYSTSDSQKTYVLSQAYAAVQKGYIVNTMAVGADADTDLLKAIAWMGNGVFIYVPGGTSTEAMEQQLLEAFQKIASMVPPGQLLGSN